MFIHPQKTKSKKNSQGGCACTPSNVPKLGVSGVKDTQKLTKIEASHVAYR